jgi:hypothetical protein
MSENEETGSLATTSDASLACAAGAARTMPLPLTTAAAAKAAIRRPVY